MSQIRTILFPTDFSDCSRAAFRFAGILAQAQAARLLIFHVKQTPGPMVAYGRAVAHIEPPGYEKRLWEVLRRFRVADSCVPVEHRLVEGDAAYEILRVAEESACDLIVMGTHGRTGLPRLVLGSIADRVLRKARCPVMTVKIPLGASAPSRPVVTTASSH